MDVLIISYDKPRVKKRYSFLSRIENVPFLNGFAMSNSVTKTAISAFHTQEEMIYQPLGLFDCPEPPFNLVLEEVRNLLDL
jgi:hypothetical protein